MREDREKHPDILSPEAVVAWDEYRDKTIAELKAVFELGKLPGRLAVAGVRGAVRMLEREHQDPEALLAERYSAFEEFMATDDGTYQADFDTHTKQGSVVFRAFTEKVQENHGIEIVEPDDSDIASIPMLNGHRLEIHRQNSGSYFLMGHVEKPQSN